MRVAPAGSQHGDVPYTVQSGGCAQPGEYIHLTPDYLHNIIKDAYNLTTFGVDGIECQIWGDFTNRKL